MEVGKDAFFIKTGNDEANRASVSIRRHGQIVLHRISDIKREEFRAYKSFQPFDVQPTEVLEKKYRCEDDIGV
jgi:hypothetical protein